MDDAAFEAWCATLNVDEAGEAWLPGEAAALEQECDELAAADRGEPFVLDLRDVWDLPPGERAARILSL